MEVTLTEKTLRTSLFVFRCVGLGTAALASASAIGLEHPVWSAMSALIVSQEQLDATRSSVTSRILGTVIGIGTACAVNLAIARFGASLYLQLAVAVLICRSHFSSLSISLASASISAAAVPLG
jgi:uncharacterized membrane protein YccC